MNRLLSGFSTTTALCLALCLASCTDPTRGLYYTVGREVSIVQSDSGLPKTFNPSRVEKYNGLYVVTGSVLFATTSNGSWPGTNNHIPLSTWSTLAMPADGLSSVSTAVLGSDFYLLSIGNNSSSTISIFKANFDSGNYTSLSASSWTEVLGGLDLATYRPERFFEVNGNLLLQAQKAVTGSYGYEYYLFMLQGSTWIPMSTANTTDNTSGKLNLYSPWTGIAYTGSNNMYWFVRTNGDIYTASATITGALTARSAKTSTCNLPLDPLIRGIYADDSDLDGNAETLYLLSGKGFVVRTTDGISWTKSAEHLKSDIAGHFVGFVTAARVVMKDISDNGATIQSTLLFGSSGDAKRFYGDGVYYLSDDAGMGLTELSKVDYNGNYTDTEFKDKGVNYLYFDLSDPQRTEKQLFACSATNGLWSALYNHDYAPDSKFPSLVWAWE